jgi:hypothetical protein
VRDGAAVVIFPEHWKIKMACLFELLCCLFTSKKQYSTAQESFKDLQNEKSSQERLMAEMQTENANKLGKLAAEAEEKLKIRENDLQSAKDRENDLLRRIQQLAVTEDELRDKVRVT